MRLEWVKANGNAKKKKKIPLKISSVTVTKFAGNCGAVNKSNK